MGMEPVLLCVIFWGIIIALIAHKNKKYKETTYYKLTKNSFWSLFFDKGRFGEYDIFKRLKNWENENTKFLFNVYIPKEDGTTTEIDVLLISPRGLVVFESKNYSGWIFGNENNKNWTQTLPQGRGRSKKSHFLNPIIQNKGHIKHLKKLIGMELDIKSVIVFSDRCVFKDLTITSNDIKVIHRHEVGATVTNLHKQSLDKELEADKIAEIYKKLLPFSQVEDCVKEQHIENIREFSKGHPNKEITKKTKNEKETVEIAADESQKILLKEDIRCPRCNGKMILRTAKKGAHTGKQFYGCSNYPKCKYIQEVE